MSKISVLAGQCFFLRFRGRIHLLASGSFWRLLAVLGFRSLLIVLQPLISVVASPTVYSDFLPLSLSCFWDKFIFEN